MAKRAASGSGSIRKKTITQRGKQYHYWEARVTVGRDPGTGRQIQRAFTGKTQQEVREKMTRVIAELDAGTYTPPCKMTVGEWLDIWSEDYLGNLKPSTVHTYERNIRNQIKPALGAVKLSDLHPHTIQRFVNRLQRGGLAPSSVKLAYRVLHAALERAAVLEYIPKNPAQRCELPRNTQAEIHPLDDKESAALLHAAKGRDVEHIITLALFTGMRLNEILGLTWDVIDFEHGTINVTKQLTRHEHREHGLFITPKSGKSRMLTPAPSVMQALRAAKRRQAEKQLRAGRLWSNPHKLVFTNEAGGPFEVWRLEHGFSACCAAAGIEGTRFHDLRHTYAVNSIRAGDDIKTVQGNLGHSTAAFTLDRYGHFTEQMRQDSAARMEGFIQDVLSL